MAYQLRPPQLRIPGIRPSDVYEHPSGIPAAHLITGQAYTMPHLGWGDDVNFYERSEQSYESLKNSLQDYFTKYGNDVNTEDYFYNPTHMLAQPSNLTDQEWDKISLSESIGADGKLLRSGFNVTATPKNLNPDIEMIISGAFNVAQNADHNLLLTKDGLLQIDEANQDPNNPQGSYGDIHEYLHSIDKAAGGDRAMSDIMGNYLTEALPYRVKNSRNLWTEQELYERWMDDPDTEHLNQVSREGFGKFLARALMDETYQNTHSGDSYKLSNHEIFTRAGEGTIRTSGKDEGFTKGMFGDLEEGFSNALASFLNSR